MILLNLAMVGLLTASPSAEVEPVEYRTPFVAAPAVVQAPLLNLPDGLAYVSKLIEATNRREAPHINPASDHSPAVRVRITPGSTMRFFHYFASRTHDWQQGFVPNFYSELSILEVAGASIEPLDEMYIFTWRWLMHDMPWSVSVRQELVGTLLSDLDDEEPIFILSNLPEGIDQAYITKLYVVKVFSDGSVRKSPA